MAEKIFKTNSFAELDFKAIKEYVDTAQDGQHTYVSKLIGSQSVSYANGTNVTREINYEKKTFGNIEDILINGTDVKNSVAITLESMIPKVYTSDDKVCGGSITYSISEINEIGLTNL